MILFVVVLGLVYSSTTPDRHEYSLALRVAAETFSNGMQGSEREVQVAFALLTDSMSMVTLRAPESDVEAERRSMFLEIMTKAQAILKTQLPKAAGELSTITPRATMESACLYSQKLVRHWISALRNHGGLEALLSIGMLETVQMQERFMKDVYTARLDNSAIVLKKLRYLDMVLSLPEADIEKEAAIASLSFWSEQFTYHPILRRELSAILTKHVGVVLAQRRFYGIRITDAKEKFTFEEFVEIDEQSLEMFRTHYEDPTVSRLVRSLSSFIAFMVNEYHLDADTVSKIQGLFQSRKAEEKKMMQSLLSRGLSDFTRESVLLSTVAIILSVREIAVSAQLGKSWVSVLQQVQRANPSLKPQTDALIREFRDESMMREKLRDIYDVKSSQLETRIQHTERFLASKRESGMESDPIVIALIGNLAMWISKLYATPLSVASARSLDLVFDAVLKNGWAFQLQRQTLGLAGFKLVKGSKQDSLAQAADYAAKNRSLKKFTESYSTGEEAEAVRKLSVLVSMFAAFAQDNIALDAQTMSSLEALVGW
jgi:hypothetical protein